MIRRNGLSVTIFVLIPFLMMILAVDVGSAAGKKKNFRRRENQGGEGGGGPKADRPIIPDITMAPETETELDFDLFSHRSCKLRQEYFQIQSGSKEIGADMHLQPSSRGKGCYETTGWVSIAMPKAKKFNPKKLRVYTEVFVDNDELRMKCYRNSSIHRRSGCGGVGSCMYCGKCSQIEDMVGELDDSAEILVDGEPVSCTNELENGNHTNVQLRFCIPNMEQIDSVYQIGSNVLETFERKESFLVKMKVYLYYDGLKIKVKSKKTKKMKNMKSNVRQRFKEQLLQYAALEKEKDGDEITEDDLDDMKFERVKKRFAIGCHKVSGLLKFVNN